MSNAAPTCAPITPPIVRITVFIPVATPVSLALNAWTSARMPWESMKLSSARSMITLRSLRSAATSAFDSRGAVARSISP